MGKSVVYSDWIQPFVSGREPKEDHDTRGTRPVSFRGQLPIEFFDFIVVDECHRSIYTVWRQVLENFDAHLIGLTATPGKQTIGFFNQNLAMEYTHENALTDGIKVDGRGGSRTDPSLPPYSLKEKG